MTVTLRDEIIDILKDVYYNNDQADPFEETYADLIINLFEKRMDLLKTHHTYTYSEMKIFQEVKEMLKE